MQFVVLLIEGITSALSPCVLPILPLYMGYLSQNAKRVNEQGEISYKRSIVLLYTLFFVLGIVMTFFILALTMLGVGQFFSDYKMQFSVLGGVFVFMMGLLQLGVIEIPYLMREYRLPKILNVQNMNLFTAFMMGFLFSFAWTPCIGPALSGVLVMASNAEMVEGFMMILVYAVGFLLPFLALGFFTAQVLTFIKTKQNLLKRLVKVGGILLLCMGMFMMHEGFALASNVSGCETSPQSQYDFTLADQYGKTHTLSKYEGKPVMITFFATWCTYCKQELAHIQTVYENEKDVVILTIIQPGGNDLSKEEIVAWLSENGYTFPVLFDETGAYVRNYGVSGYPFSFFVKKDGEFYGYVPGYVDEANLVKLLEQLKEQ